MWVFEGRPSPVAVPIRSVRGVLLTVLGTSALVGAGLWGSARVEPWYPDALSAVFGTPLVVATLGLGALVWMALVAAEAVAGRRVALSLAAVAVVAAPWLAVEAETAFWERRTEGVGWAGSAVAWPTSAVGHIRGSLGVACDGAYAIRLRLDENGRGVGTAQWVDVGPFFTLTFAFASLDGPGSFAVRGERVGDTLHVTALVDRPGETWRVPVARP